MEILSYLLVLVVLIGLSGFFSGVEVALVSVGELKARHLLDRKVPGARALNRLKQKPERMITTILIGNNIVNVAASALATYVATQSFGYLGVGVATGLMTFIILVFGEITPKTFAANHNEMISLAVAPLIELLEKILYPLIIFFETISKLVNRLTGKKSQPLLTEEELKTIVKVGYEEEVLDEKDRQLIEGVIRFDDIAVKDVMTPRVKLFTLQSDLKVEEAMKLTAKRRFSRIPVYEKKKPESITGVVNIRDIMRAYLEDSCTLLSEIARKPFFTSKEKRINKLFTEMQARHQHMAIVVNEYGGVEGVITLENLLEEIVGEIIDESDVSPELIVKADKNKFIVHGETQISLLEDILGREITHPKEYSTVAGLLHHHFKDIPRKDSEAVIDGISFRVDEVKENMPVKIRVQKQD